MKTPEVKDLKFHNENVVSRITLWANIMAFVILAIALISFIYDAYSIITNWESVVMSLPTNVLERIAIFSSKVFMSPAVGVFYFLVLRGLAQLLNLGMDLFYQNVEEDEAEA
jgi:uncharacterized membrane protein YdfJ with MMPL/SSD domain